MTTNGKIALVTGTGSGIGRAVSLALQAAGYSVVLAGLPRSETRADRCVGKALRRQDAPLVCLRQQPRSVRALFTGTKEAFGQLGVLFNNTGISAHAIPMEDLTFEQWNGVVSASYSSSCDLTQQTRCHVLLQICHATS